MKNADMPAMPTKGGMVFYIPEELTDDVKAACEEVIKQVYHGLTKREEFAKAAMQGLLAAGRLSTAEFIKNLSYNYADAMLEEGDEQ